MSKKGFLILVLIAFVIQSYDLFAQCAMCKAVAGSNIESDANDVGKGLNTGILYLMTIPYILLFGLFILFFRDKIKAKLSSIKFK